MEDETLAFQYEEMPEDVEKTTLDDLQDVVEQYNAKIEELLKAKEKDLMEI